MRSVSRNAAMLIFLLFGFLSGCSNLPIPGTPEDCLVVIRTATVNSTGITPERLYEFNFSSDHPPVLVSSTMKGYIAIIVRQSGVVVRSVTTYVPDSSGKMVRAGVYKNFQILPYEPGRLVIADFSFVQTVKESGYNQYSMYFEFVKTTDKDKKNLRGQLEKDGHYVFWAR